MAQKIIIAQGIEIRDVGQGTFLQSFLSTNCDPKTGATSTWIYPKGAPAKATHEVEVVYTKTEFTTSLNTADIFVVYEGHSRYGQGPAFGPAGTPKIPDVKTFPVNPWGVHYRMGYDATDTECIGDLVHHSVVPTEYDLPSATSSSFLPAVLEEAAKKAQGVQKSIKAKKIKASAVCSTAGAWRLFDTCESALSKTTTTRGDKPLKGRHYYRKHSKEFDTSVKVGSADLDTSTLACKLLFMASCSSHPHFFQPLDKRRKAAKSKCKFLMTGLVCATTHATTFLEQILIKKVDPMTKAGMKQLLKALNGATDSGIVGVY